MEKVIINFTVTGQKLINNTPENFASDTVEYIEAHFDLGENWDFDTVRAIWTNGADTISAVLYDGACDVPPEVLTKRRKVFVNLVGSDIENGELVDRLTSCQVEALDICCKALIDGTETTPITPSQFEQFVSNVKADAGRAETARDEAESIKTDVQGLKADTEQLKTDTESIKDDVERTADGFDSKVSEALEDISDAKTDALSGINSAKTQAVNDVTAEGTTQKDAISSLATEKLTAIDEEGETQIGLVQAEGDAQIFEIDQKGKEVIESIPLMAPVITDTVNGSIVSITDGAEDYPLKSLKVQINPIQEGSGDPSPTNIRPIKGWDGVNIYQSGADTSDPQVHSITFKDSQGNPITVYGGNMNITDGEGGDEYKYRQITSFSGAWGAVPNGYAVYFTDPETNNRKADIDPNKMACNMFAYTDKVRADAPTLSYGGPNGGERTQTFILPSSVTSLAEANEWLADLSEPLYATFKLANPTPIYCDPTELKTLLGVNNIWADTGDSECEYCCDTKLYIDKLING